MAASLESSTRRGLRALAGLVRSGVLACLRDVLLSVTAVPGHGHAGLGGQVPGLSIDKESP
ncbi:MAG: hypothetical protein RLY71_3521 [Pseudomonadota bacterium]|jgi:hypothetical protein